MANPCLELLSDPPKDWSAYYRALEQADRRWADWCAGEERTYGIFSGDSTYLQTIEAGKRAMRGDWSTFTREDAQIALGLWTDNWGYEYALLGSMKAAGRAKRFFLSSTPQQLAVVREMLAPVIAAAPRDIARLAGEAVEGITSIDGIGMAVATRLLALTRPDALVSVNRASRRNLASLSGLSVGRIGTAAAYSALVRWTLDQPWWNSLPPIEPSEIAAWESRAALLDCFVQE